MSELPPKQETAPFGRGVDAFERLLNKGVWDERTEAELDSLLEEYEADLEVIYINYQELGGAEMLQGSELHIYERLAAHFDPE